MNIKSILYHKVYFRKRTSNPPRLQEKILGYTVEFFSYAQLIDLFEEIFIYEAYKLNRNHLSPYIIDCGSNIGLSILYFKKIFPASIILAFEPDKLSFALLENNIARNNLSTVKLLNFALSDIEESKLLYKNPLSGSLTNRLIESADDWHKEVVQAVKLSTYIDQKINAVKIDVEGYESKILEDLIKSNKMTLIEEVIVEYHPNLTNVSTEDFMTRMSSYNFASTTRNDKLHEGVSETIIHLDNKLYYQ